MLKISASLILVFVISLNLKTVHAQDQIITNSLDTIDCKIIRVSQKSVFYKFQVDNKMSKIKIARDKLQTWKIDENDNRERNDIFDKNQTGKWRLSFNSGLGHRIASTKESKQVLVNHGFSSSNVDSYFRQIRTGIKTSGQIHYMFWQNYGLGIDYQFHRSSGTITGSVDPGDNYTLLYGELNDNIFTNYSGLSLYYQQWLNPKFKIYYQISMGISYFRQESVFLYNASLITGKAFGGNTEIGFEYFLRKNIAFNVNTALFQSTISKIKVDNGFSTSEINLEKEQMEGLSRIDLEIGLKIYF